MPRHLGADDFPSSVGVSLGSHPRAGVPLRLPHWALPAARRGGQAALQRGARGKVLPGLPDTSARYGSSLAVPAPDLPPQATALVPLLRWVKAIEVTAGLATMIGVTIQARI